jgi:hypothetical protein
MHEITSPMIVGSIAGSSYQENVGLKVLAGARHVDPLVVRRVTDG